MYKSSSNKKPIESSYILRARDIWKNIINLFLIFEKIRWFIIVVFITILRNFFFYNDNKICQFTEFYMIKALLALYGVKINSKERETIRYTKTHKGIFLSNLSSSLDPLITRY